MIPFFILLFSDFLLLLHVLPGRCSFTNNLSENAIRPLAVDRKNWLFSSSVDGANASAVVYTMVKMAKAHDLNIYGYLKFLLEHRPSKDMTDEQLADYGTLYLWIFRWREPPSEKSRPEYSTLEWKTPIYQKSHVNYSELLQLAKGWSNLNLTAFLFGAYDLSSKASGYTRGLLEGIILYYSEFI